MAEAPKSESLPWPAFLQIGFRVRLDSHSISDPEAAHTNFGLAIAEHCFGT